MKSQAARRLQADMLSETVTHTGPAEAALEHENGAPGLSQQSSTLRVGDGFDTRTGDILEREIPVTGEPDVGLLARLSGFIGLTPSWDGGVINDTGTATSRAPEVKLPEELHQDVANMNALGDTANLLYYLDADTPLRVRTIVKDRATSARDMTVRELCAESRQSGFELFGIRLPASFRSQHSLQVPAHVRLDDDLKEILGREDDKGRNFRALIGYASGEWATLRAPRIILAEALRQPNVICAKMSSGSPSDWMPTVLEVSPELRGADQAGAFNKCLRQIFPKDFIKRAKETDIAGMTIFHGTLRGFESSIRAGAKNVGTGLGGSGLTVAVEGEWEIAEAFAGRAYRDKARDDDFAGQFDGVDGGAHEPIVLEGSISGRGAEELRVARITVSDDVRTLKSIGDAVLPGDWAEDPRIFDFVMEHTDILDFHVDWPMPRDANRMLVIHESAAQALTWNEQTTKASRDA